MSGIGREFMKKTRYGCLGRADQMKGLQQPPLEMPYDPSAETLALPAPEDLVIPSFDLRKAVAERRSVRQYSQVSLNREELAFLLWSTQGVKSASNASYRTVPSAGARHAIETYLLANRIQNIPPGLYRYLVLDHRLLSLSREKDLAGNLTAACFNQKMVRDCAVVFLWVAVPYRMTWRYGERGYRYLHLDAGHVCQNLYLAAEAVGCGVCAIGAFSDEEVNRILELDGKEAFAIYLAAAGKITTRE